MEYTIHEINKFRIAGRILVISLCATTLYTLFTDGLFDIRGHTVGFAIGITEGIIVSIFELWIFSPQIRRKSFIGGVLIRTVFYFLHAPIVVIVIKGSIDSLFYGMGFVEYLTSEEFQQFLYFEDFDRILVYYFFILSLIIFTLQMSRKMGYRTLVNFITGKYHRPKEEERIFMFLDLRASTSMAEKLGDITFHKLLNEFFYDITKCILTTKGEIYRYVGDEIVVSWEKDKGVKDANCIRTYYYIIYELRKHREKYIRKYGFVPQFTASFHCGKVIVGEIGEVKSQIVFHGEALYINSKVEKKCGELQKSILITENLIQLLTIPPVYRVEECGKLNQVSEDKSIRLFSLQEIDAPSN